MNLEWLPGLYTVCQLANLSAIDWTADLLFLARTDEEFSLVCPAGREPANVVAQETGWRAFRVAGPLDFGLVGILAKLAAALADAGISIFAVSTYNTDYILIKDTSRAAAESALTAAGWRFPEGDPLWT